VAGLMPDLTTGAWALARHDPHLRWMGLCPTWVTCRAGGPIPDAQSAPRSQALPVATRAFRGPRFRAELEHVGGGERTVLPDFLPLEVRMYGWPSSRRGYGLTVSDLTSRPGCQVRSAEARCSPNTNASFIL
jgi:hypothetical protein